MLPLETKQSGGKLIPHSGIWWGDISRGNIQQQALQEKDYKEKKKEKHSYKNGTWNVRTLNLGG
jgi:hypothetical protein